MRVYLKLLLLAVFIFTLNSCNESNYGDASLYGQNQTANPRYTRALNQRGNNFDIAQPSRWLNDQMSGPTGVNCPPGTRGGLRLRTTLTKREKASLGEELGEIPAVGGAATTQLPKIKVNDQNAKKFGYYRYKDDDQKVFGTKRTIWRIRAAARILADKGIIMGIGDISSKGGRTKGHKEHQQGQDVDFRLISKKGLASPCTVSNTHCFDRENTFQMIKTLIDVDPTKVDKILVNDPVLRTKVNDYYSAVTGSPREVIPYMKKKDGHFNHVHFSWKRR